MSIGLKRGEVAVENHQIEWENSAKSIINLLKNTLNNDIVDAQHIGSTSIKTICAKPIIDIVVGVKDFKDILKHNGDLSKLGIIYRRQDHPNQQLYVCGDLQNNIQTHFIHVVIFNSKEWHDYINMRDYLNANEEKANEYSNLKIKLANEYPNDRIAYTQAKSKLIEEILKSAALWREINNNPFIENQLNEIGIDLLNFLADNDMNLNQLGGYWKNQSYYQVKYKNEAVCYILFNGKGDEERFSPLTVWTDDSNSDWYKECHLDKSIQKIAVTKIDVCEKCGSCAGGKVKIIFGKEYNNVCKTTFRFVNPNNDELNCIKSLLLLRKNDIEKNKIISEVSKC